jgi:outer membrane protein TolC
MAGADHAGGSEPLFRRLARVSDIELEVRQADLTLRDAEEQLKVASQAIVQADEGVREIESRYRGQAATVTQLIDAQVAAANARIRRANAAADLEIARAAMERVAGRLTRIMTP